MLPRVFLAALFASLSVKVGLGYIHTCQAGSRLLEWGAVLGAPLLVVALVLFVHRVWLGILGAALVTLGVYVLCRPYLDWAHGS